MEAQRERDELGARLVRSWERARAGAGRAIVVVGDAGMGKTTLLRSFAAEVGDRVVVQTAVGGVLSQPMGAALALVEALAEATSARQAQLGDLADAVQVGTVLAGLLDRAGEDHRRPTAVIVDDVHELDPASRTALNLAVRRASPPHLLVVMSGRPRQSVRAFAEGLLTLEVAPLPDDEAVALLQASSPVPIDSSVLARLLAVAGGNPLALRSLPSCLDEAHLTGAALLPDPLPLDGDLRLAFTRPLAALGRPGRMLLELAAVARDAPFTALSDAMDGLAEEALAELEETGLAALVAGRLRLRHPLLGDAVRHGMAPADRRRLHRVLGASAGLSPEVQLLHRAQGAVAADEGLVDELVMASAAIRSRTGPEAAARMLDRAVGLTDDPERRARLQVDAAEVLAAAGASSPARRRLERVLDDGADARITVSAQVRLAALEAVGGAPAVAWQRLVGLLDGLSPDEEVTVRTALVVPLGMMGLAREILEQSDAALELAKPDSTPWHVARLAHAHAEIAVEEGDAQEVVDEVLPAIDLDAALAYDPQVGLHIGRALGMAARPDLATTVLASLAERAREQGARAALAMAFGALGEVQIRTCRLTDARRTLSEAVALSMATGQRAFAPFWLGLRSRAAAIQGDDEQADADLDLAVGIADDLQVLGARYFLRGHEGLTWLGRGDPEQAITALEEVMFFEEMGGTLAPNTSRWRPDLIEAYLLTDRPDAAMAVAEPLAAAALQPGASTWTRAASLWVDGMLLAEDDPAAACDLLARAEEAFDPARDHLLERGRVQLRRARALRQLGRQEDVADALARARFAFRSIGALPWSAMAEDTPAGEVGVDTADRAAPAAASPVALDALTDAELRVLAAASTGLTNQQIASRLRLSPKTVANHLHRVYRKLDVGSRTEAARAYLTG